MVLGPRERPGLVRGRRRQVSKVKASMTIQTGLYRPTPRSPVGARPRSISRPTGFRADVKEIIVALKETALGRGIPLPGIGMAGRAMQLRAIGRQQLARVPLAGKVAVTGAAGLGAAAAIEVTTGRSPARIVHDVGRDIFDTGRRQPRRQVVARNGHGGDAHVVVRTWQTFPGGPVFERYSDGHIEVQKKDGTIKHFRPYRPVVIPRKWNARSMSRVATALKRHRKTATKILRITGGVPTKKVRVSSRSHRSVDVDD